jgi:hypothetical protein
MNDIDTLMSRVEEINRKTDIHDITPDDIATLITHYRRLRARKAAGLKDERPKPTIDLSRLLNLPAPTARPGGSQPSITRR